MWEEKVRILLKVFKYRWREFDLFIVLGLYCRENWENSLFDVWKVIKKIEFFENLFFSYFCKYIILV